MHKALLSYCHADADKARRLLVHLAPLQQAQALEVLYDRQIEPGKAWSDEIQHALTYVDLAILLISTDFLFSRLCQDSEIVYALEQARYDGLLVLPIITDFCSWHDANWLSGLQVLPIDGMPVTSQNPQSKAWTEIARGVNQCLGTLPPPRSTIVQQNVLPDPTPLSVDSLLQTLPQVSGSFFGREKELQNIQEAFDNPQVHGMSITAFGGVGKSSLLRQWLIQNAPSKYRYIGCSFYSQGSYKDVSSEPFILHMLQLLDDHDSSHGNLIVKGERLADLISKHPTIIVLDGFEPMQFGPDAPSREGEIRDPGMRAFLRRMLTYAGRSFFILTSRQPILGESFKSEKFRQTQLNVLSKTEARHLLRSHGVGGSNDAVDQSAEYLGRHALAIRLAAEYVNTFHHGQIRNVRDTMFASHSVREGRHSRFVMEAYASALVRDGNIVDVQILYLLGLFDRPARWEWMEAVWAEPAIANLTDHLAPLSDMERWESLSRLRQWSLISSGGLGTGSEINVHPLIREYFAEVAVERNQTGWRAAHERLFRYLEGSTEELPDTLREMEPLLLAVVHACKSGYYKHALNAVLIPRVFRGERQFAVRDLEAQETVLGVLIHFFSDRSWYGQLNVDAEHGQDLSVDEQVYILVTAGLLLEAIRGYAAPEARACLAKAKELGLNDTHQEVQIAFGTWVAALARGELIESGFAAASLGELAKKTKDKSVLAVVRRVQATQFFYTGNFSESEKCGREGVDISDGMPQEELALEYVVDPLIMNLAYGGLAAWHLGYLDDGRERCLKASELAHTIKHPHTLVVTIYLNCVFETTARDKIAAERWSNDLMMLCEENGFPLWHSAGKIMHGWALAAQGQTETGLQQMRKGISSWELTGSNLFKGFWTVLLAEVLISLHRNEQVYELIEESIEICCKEPRWYESELYRMKGRYFAMTHDITAATEAFNSAISVARRVGAVPFRIRALTDLCELVTREELPHIDVTTDLEQALKEMKGPTLTPDIAHALDALRKHSKVSPL